MKFHTQFLGALALIMTPMLACSDGADSAEGNGSVSVQLTDAPGDNITAAVVTISQIYLVGDDTNGRIVLSNEVFVTDLISLHNDVEILAEDVIIPNGRYSQLRLVIDGAYVETVQEGEVRVYATTDYDQVPAGVTVYDELKTPSWDTSGLKVKLPNDALIIADNALTLVVDFDVAESFQTETGNGKWILRPNIQATDLNDVGSVEIAVSVNASLQMADVTAANLSVVLIDKDGNFEGTLPLVDLDNDGDLDATFVYLTPSEGPFTVALKSDSRVVATTPTAPMSVSVASGQQATVTLELDALTLP